MWRTPSSFAVGAPHPRRVNPYYWSQSLLLYVRLCLRYIKWLWQRLSGTGLCSISTLDISPLTNPRITTHHTHPDRHPPLLLGLVVPRLVCIRLVITTWFAEVGVLQNGLQSSLTLMLMSFSFTSQPWTIQMNVGRLYPKQKVSALVLKRQFYSSPICRRHRINQCRLAVRWSRPIRHDKVQCPIRHDKIQWIVNMVKWLLIHKLVKYKVKQCGMVWLLQSPQRHMLDHFNHYITQHLMALNPYSTRGPCTT